MRLGLRFYRIWLRTLRYEIRGVGEFREIAGCNAIFALWHNRIFTGIEAYRQFRLGDFRMHGLVSASRDGGILSEVFRHLRIVPVRGSSSRRGSQALRELVRVLDDGGDVAITLDGPRGPVYRAHPGVALLIAKSKVPIVLFGAEFEDFWCLRSWDRFMIPKPFSRVRWKFELMERPPDESGSLDKKELLIELEARLRHLNPDREPGI